MTHFIQQAFATAITVLALSTAMSAQELAAPKGDVILTVTGAITTTNVGQSAQYDIAMLMALDDTVIETTTIWTEGTQIFQGVSLHVLTKALGITQGTLFSTALNDYTVEIPVSDAQQGGPILAYMVNGAEMSVREKGPLWIIYPYDSDAIYRSEVIYSRSIWQLDRIQAVK